jgi:hypothetical protein
MSVDVNASSASTYLVGRYLIGDEPYFLPVSQIDLDRATKAYGAVLDSFPAHKGRYSLTISRVEEAVQYVPFEDAVIARQMTVTNADASIYEGARVEASLRRFDVAFVVGVDASILESLRGLGHDPHALFAGKIIWARPDAYAQLREGASGYQLLRWVEFGPAVGVECSKAAGVHLCSQEWAVEEDGGEIVITSRMPRVQPVSKLRTGVRGAVVHEPCTCGAKGVRVSL